MKESNNSSPTTADTQLAKDIIFNIMIHKARKKNDPKTINKEYESIKNNIDGIVKIIQSPLACTELCGNKSAYKSRLGRKNMLTEAGNAYRNADVRPSQTNTLSGKIFHKFKQAVNYLAPVAFATLGVGATAVGGLATVMTGGATTPLLFASAGVLGTMSSLLFGKGTTKHNGVSDANYYNQKANEIMNDDVKDKGVDKLKKNVVTLTKALVKLQGGLVSLNDEDVGKYCQKLKDLVKCIQKKEEEQKIKNNDQQENNINIDTQKSLYNNDIKNSKNDAINKYNLTEKGNTEIYKINNQ